MILHIDDQASWGLMVKGALRGEFIVICVSSIEEAREALKRGMFDLIITDGTVTIEKDGEQLAEELWDEGYRVIIFSGNDPHETIPFVLKEGIASVGVLKAKIAQMLGLE